MKLRQFQHVVINCEKSIYNMEQPKLSVNMILPKISFDVSYTYKYKVNFGRCFKLQDYKKNLFYNSGD